MFKKRLLSLSRNAMTLPDERYRAVFRTAEFLAALQDSRSTPRVPKSIREQARSLLRHYPTHYDLKRIEQLAPEVMVERYEDLQRFIISGAQQQDEEQQQ
jgi:hypothetical protein